MSRTSTPIRLLPAAALVALSPLVHVPAVASDAGRITGPSINRPGVALPYGNGNPAGSVVQPQQNKGPVIIPGVQAPQGPQGQAEQETPVQITKEPSLFTHPTRGFSMPIPPGVAVSHRGKEMHVAIRSPKGYVMNLQTGDSNDHIPLPGMVGRLESRYLGDRGPWLRKLSDEQSVIAGLPAADVSYQGHRTRTRVVIARGNKTDFVFTFTAPLDLYEEHAQIFDWVLTHFKPGPDDLQSQAPVAQATQDRALQAPAKMPVRAGDSVASFAAGRPDPGPAATPAPNMNRFTEPGYGFLMDYPKEWSVDKPTAFSATFSGPEGAASHDAVVSIQNVNPAGAQTGDQAAVIATADLLEALETGTRGMQVLGEGKLAESPGSQFIARYEYSGKTYRKWAVVVPRPKGTIAHIWSFTAPEAAFESYRPVAESMLRSWTLTQ